MRRRFVLALLATVAVTGCSSWKSRTEIMAADVVAQLTAAGFKDVAYASVEGDENAFVVKNLKGHLPPAADGKRPEADLNITVLSIERAAKEGEGWKAGLIQASGLAFTPKGMPAVSIRSLAAGDVSFVRTPSGPGNFTASLLQFRDAVSTYGPTELGRMAALDFSLKDWTDGSPRASDVKVRGLKLAKIPVPGNVDLIEKAQNAPIDIDWAMSWNREEGWLAIDNFALVLGDIASVTASVRLRPTMADVASLRLSADPEDVAASFATLPYMAVDKASVTFQNGSLVQSLVKSAAASGKMTPPAVMAGVLRVVADAVAPIKDEVLKGRIMQVAGAFLREPRILTVKATLAQPKRLNEIVELLSDKPDHSGVSIEVSTQDP